MGADDDGGGGCDELHELGRELHHRVIELRFDGGSGIVTGTPLLDVADDADDLGFSIELSDVDVLADGVRVGEVGAGEDIVDVDDGGGVFVVVVGDEAAAEQGHAHGALEAGLDEIEHGGMHVVIVVGFGFAFDPEGEGGVVDHGAGAQGDGDGFNTGDGAHGGFKLTEAGARFRSCGFGIGGQRDGEGDGVVGLVARIDAPESGEGAEHEAGTDEEDEGHSNLDSDEETLEAMTRAAGAAA